MDLEAVPQEQWLRELECLSWNVIVVFKVKNNRLE